MEVRNISRDQNTSYDPFLLDALNINKVYDKKTQEIDKNGNPDSELNKTSWQKDILINALDKLENSIQIDDKSHPLGGAENVPIETYSEALDELKKLVESNFSQYASKAQANLTPGDILYLFEDSYDFVV